MYQSQATGDIAPASFALSMDCQNAVMIILIPINTILSANNRIAIEAFSTAPISLTPKNFKIRFENTAQRVARTPPLKTATINAFQTTIKIPSTSDSPTKNDVTVESAPDAPSNMPAGIVLTV